MLSTVKRTTYEYGISGILIPDAILHLAHGIQGP